MLRTIVTMVWLQTGRAYYVAQWFEVRVANCLQQVGV
jgi:hypothetical protein